MTGSDTDRNYIWDAADQLKAFYIQAGTSEPSIYAQYLYSGGSRVKKIVRTSGGDYEVTVYDGPFEYCKKVAGSTTYEKNYSHVEGIAEVRTGTAFPGDITDSVVYQLPDHLGSSNLRLSTTGTIIDKEEYYPFGDTSLRTFTFKRYRYVGKEKDSESGLYYYGARYYAVWTCRFISVDPLAGVYAHLNPYNYAGNKPINSIDIDGMQGDKEPESETGGGNNDDWWDSDPNKTHFGVSAVEVTAKDPRPWWKKAASWVKNNVDTIQTVLAVVSFIPILGKAADILSAGIDIATGNYAAVATTLLAGAAAGIAFKLLAKPASKLLKKVFKKKSSTKNLEKSDEAIGGISDDVPSGSGKPDTPAKPDTPPGSEAPKPETPKTETPADNPETPKPDEGVKTTESPSQSGSNNPANSNVPPNTPNGDVPDKFKPFVRANYRDNLAVLTGINPKGFDAHHIFPKKFRPQMQQAGVNIDDPHLLVWWEQSAHRTAANAYNLRWQDFFRNNPNPKSEEILNFGRELMKNFGFDKLNY